MTNQEHHKPVRASPYAFLFYFHFPLSSNLLTLEVPSNSTSLECKGLLYRSDCGIFWILLIWTAFLHAYHDSEVSEDSLSSDSFDCYFLLIYFGCSSVSNRERISAEIYSHFCQSCLLSFAYHYKIPHLHSEFPLCMFQ